MPTVLDRIVANKREEIAFAKTRRDLQSLIAGAKHGPEIRDFLLALQGHEYVRLIAEEKRASPSKGMIRPQFDPTDIALAYETVAGEARDSGIALLDHVRHLVVHGILHLLGYDHETGADAERMEALETRVLAGLGVADPYGP